MINRRDQERRKRRGRERKEKREERDFLMAMFVPSQVLVMKLTGEENGTILLLVENLAEIFTFFFQPESSVVYSSISIVFVCILTASTILSIGPVAQFKSAMVNHQLVFYYKSLLIVTLFVVCLVRQTTRFVFLFLRKNHHNVRQSLR